MRVKIIANKPIDDGCVEIKEHIGKEFETYVDNGDIMVANDCGEDFIVFEGEYEIIKS